MSMRNALVMIGCVVVIGMTAVLASCAGPGEKGITPAEFATGSCETYNHLRETATTLVDKDVLDYKVFFEIDEADRITEPYCGKDAKPPLVDDSTMKVAINAGISIIFPLVASFLE